MNGMDHLLNAVLRLAGLNLPDLVARYQPTVDATVAMIPKVQEVVVSTGARLDSMDAKLDAIMRHLGMPEALQAEQDALAEHETRPVLMIANGD